MSLRIPSPSPSPSPGPHEGAKASARQSMGPSARGTPGLAPASPRPGGQSNARPTSELLVGSGMFQTPEAEALDQWFANLQSYEATLEEMAAASLDVNFKEELGAIEQWFKVLSEAERTAALYSLLQHSTQVQIRFFITVLQQMARSDPMTALLSPAMGGSMQSQMEAKLASMKSPGLKSGLPASPTARSFNHGNRQSLILENSSNFLSPESAATAGGGQDAAATLAQQRAKLKATNAAHRISAPVLVSSGSDARGSWGPSQLAQVSEQNSGGQEITINPSRPKSTEFSGSINSPRFGGDSIPSGVDWASMVNTPLLPMFKKETAPAPDNTVNRMNDWGNKSAAPGVPIMGEVPNNRRRSKMATENNNNQSNNAGQGNGGAIYDDNGNLVNAGQQQQQQQQARNNASGGSRNASGGNNGYNGAPAGWTGSRSPGLQNVPSNRFNGVNDDGGGNNGLGMQMGNLGNFGMGLASPGMGGMGMPNMMPPMSPFNVFSAMGISPETQLLAAQMAASGFAQPAWLGMPMSAGLNNRRTGPTSGRSTGQKSPSTAGSRPDGSTPKAEDDVDPALLNDVPAWLRSLRLHKYTPNFENMRWQDMVVMDEQALEVKGVAALGARRKMLKTFELVRKKMGIEGSAPGSAATSSSAKTP